MKKSDPLIDYYRQRAGEYERIYFRNIPEKQKELADEADRLRVIVAGREILDLACGTGYWTKIIAETASHTVAADIADEVLREAQKKQYTGPVEFVRCDLYRLPFAAERFDVVTLGFWFSHEPRQNYAAFFDRLKPLIRPGGRIWMMDNNPPAEGPETESAATDSAGNNYKKRRLDNGREFEILKNYFSRSQLEDIFAPYFKLEALTYNPCYWSVLLTNPMKS